jgi:hypothetical protein
MKSRYKIDIFTANSPCQLGYLGTIDLGSI